MTSSSVGPTSSDSDETPEAKSKKKMKQFSRQWQFKKSNEYGLSRTEFLECRKACALLLNVCGALDDQPETSTPDDTSSEEVGWVPLVLSEVSLDESQADFNLTVQ